MGVRCWQGWAGQVRSRFEEKRKYRQLDCGSMFKMFGPWASLSCEPWKDGLRVPEESLE